MRFADRRHAGRALGAALASRIHGDVLVLGLPRGGVPVAAEVARALDAPLDVLCVRKLGLPSHPELALGAISEDGARVLDHELIARTGVTPNALDAVEARELVELARQAERYRGARPPLPVVGRTVVIVDDGLATGATAFAAAQAVRARGARTVIVAVPVAPADTEARFGAVADAVVVLTTPARFMAVGEWYDDFGPTSDAEVLAALADAPPTPSVPAGRTTIRVPVDGVALDAIFDVPDRARGTVVFVHGSGSSRHSRRNQAVARWLNAHGFATLLFDLLTEPEGADRAAVFDIELLTHRLTRVIEWLGARPEVRELPIGLFGASTGAAAALRAAADPDSPVEAVVSRGGRPDLAGAALGAVRCPVLLVVGGADAPTLAINREAVASLRAPYRLEVVPGASHLFEESGALERVAQLATAWFELHLREPTADVARSGDRAH